MEPVEFKRAYYIKLGEKGKYEQSAISESKLIIGYSGQSIQDINNGNWEKIREQLFQASKGKKGVATRDLNGLRQISESTSEDLWITFYQEMMWWCRLGPKEVFQGDKSKYRLVDGKWSNRDVCDNPLEINSIPGILSKIQGFRGTVCKVRALETLKRLVNNESSPEYKEIVKCKTELINSVEKGIKKLNPKDFETFVDLVFRESGWRRVSPKGETMKYVDLELEDPITKERYQVQIKTRATFEDFESYAKKFTPRPPLRWFYFVVHSPTEELKTLKNPWPNVKLIGPGQLSEMVVRLGLADWLMSHIK
jgi:hypothetical protein